MNTQEKGKVIKHSSAITWPHVELHSARPPAHSTDVAVADVAAAEKLFPSETKLVLPGINNPSGQSVAIITLPVLQSCYE